MERWGYGKKVIGKHPGSFRTHVGGNGVEAEEENGEKI